MRVTRDGMVFLLLATALTAVAMVSGNNLLFLVVAPLWSVWLIQWPLGRLNVYGLAARRVLPAELYAGQPAGGHWLLLNPRRGLSARGLRVQETEGSALASVARVASAGSARVPATWSFGQRGRVTLGRVSIASSWPFGLMEHEVGVELPAEVLVYPTPGRRAQRASPRARHGQAESTRVGGGGDFLGLRAYRSGDSPRAIHWPATARLGRPMVVERAQEAERAVRVVLPDRSGAAWERELSRACGEVHRATERGEAVSLRVTAGEGVEGLELPPGRGQAWRRQLLDVLALLPVRA